MAAGGLRGDVFQHKFYITIVNWKNKSILRAFCAHQNWINTLRCLPFKNNGKRKDCLISGSADEKACFWDTNSGKVLKKFSTDGDRVVMHGMRLFVYEEKQEKKFFLVSGGYNDNKNLFKLWA